METLITSFIFIAVAGVTFAVANRFVKRWLPASRPASQAAMVVVSILLVFASVFFFTAWGLNPTVIQINLQQSLNPLRWVNWVLSALNFGVAQAFILALFRSRVERARRLGALPPPVREAEQTPAEATLPVPVLEADGAAETPPLGEPAHPPESDTSESDPPESDPPESADEPRNEEKEHADTPGFARPSSEFFTQDRKRTAHLAKKSPAFTRGDRAAVVVLAIWIVVQVIVLSWVRTL